MSTEQMALQFRDVLKARERLPRADVCTYQSDLVGRLVQHAAAHVPFYAERLGPVLRDGKVDLDRWPELPLLSRAGVQDAASTLFARELPPYFGPVREGRTSGSTGRPVRYRYPQLHEVASLAQTDRMFGWWRLDGRKALASFSSVYAASAQSGKTKAAGWRLGVPGGVRHIFELMADFDRQIDWLKQVAPSYLFVRGGAHVAQLAVEARKRGERLRFECIVSVGSAVTEEARRLAHQVFRSQIADQYGAAETGLIAGQCPDCGLYHMCDETVLVELLRADGNACAEGEVGRVAVTPLYNYAMPLIRYEIGDYATRGPERARCGRGLGSLTNVIGRYRNVFVLRDGRVVHPYANAARLGAHLSYRQIQIVQTDYEDIEIRYVPDDAARTPNLAAIERLMQAFLDPGVRVTLVRLERFEGDPSGKFEETVSLVAANAPAA